MGICLVLRSIVATESRSALADSLEHSLSFSKAHGSVCGRLYMLAMLTGVRSIVTQ